MHKNRPLVENEGARLFFVPDMVKIVEKIFKKPP